MMANGGLDRLMSNPAMRNMVRPPDLPGLLANTCFRPSECPAVVACPIWKP